MNRNRLLRRSVALAAVAGLALSAAACSSGAGNGKGQSGDSGKGAVSATLDPSAKVAISIDCQPPVTKTAERKQWAADVAAFNRLYPNVTINSKDASPCEDPAPFSAQLAGRTQTDVFYTYFTDLNQVLDAGQAEDISAYS